MKKGNKIATLFLTGLLVFTMTGCAENNEPKEETQQGDKTETKETTYLTDEETRSLKAGDILDYGKLPNRKILEENKLDYITICDSYSYKTTDFDEEPKNTEKFEYDGEVETHIKSEEEASYYNAINSYLNENKEVVWYELKPLRIKIISFEYADDGYGNTKKELTVNGRTFLEDLLCEECVKE